MLYVASLVVSFVFFFLSVGVLAGNGANVVVPYVSLAIAIALSLSTLIVGIVKTRKPGFQQTKDNPYKPTVQMHSEKPAMPVIQVPSEEPVITAQPVKNEQKEQKFENTYLKPNIKPTEQPITQPFSYQKMQENTTNPKAEEKERIKEPSKIVENPSAKKNAVKSTSNEKTIPKNETTKENKGPLTCPKCNKQFSQPIFMANYNDPQQPKLIAHCPYCDQTLDIKQNNSEEELLKKYF